MPSRLVRNISKDELRAKAKMIRREVVRLTHICGSGHYGSAFSIAELLAVLYYQLLPVKPDEPQWSDRDRFTMGKGHAAIGLYPVLADLGFFPTSDLDNYTRLFSPLGDHPDLKKVKDADFSWASRARARSGRPRSPAAHWKLDNLIGLVDINGAGSDGDPQKTMATEPLKDKWASFGWDAFLLPDGHDLDDTFNILSRAVNEPREKPAVVLAYTVARKGVSFMEGTWQWHPGFLGPKDLERAYREIEAGEIG